jgi:hypothetical protein
MQGTRCVRFVLHKVTMEESFLRLLPFSPVSIIPPTNSSYSFTYLPTEFYNVSNSQRRQITHLFNIGVEMIKK